jgi:DNA-binding NarL/FixJ family response regulator
MAAAATSVVIRNFPGDSPHSQERPWRMLQRSSDGCGVDKSTMGILRNTTVHDPRPRRIWVAFSIPELLTLNAASISLAKKPLTRTVVVDGHTSVREMLVMLLRQEGCFEVVGAPGVGHSGTDAARVEWAMPDAELLQEQEWPMQVVVYSGTMDEGLLREALAERPHGFVRKQDSVSDLRETLQAALAGVRHVSRSSEHLVRTRGEDIFGTLTLQESAVVQMTAEGRYTKEIATTLGASVRTVEYCKENIMRKLGVRDVASLTRYAIRRRMVRT